MAAMLPLDSPRWADYGHAYCSASDVPGWLRELESGNRDKAKGDIWSALWHQGAGYSAAFLAVPHLVRIGENLEPKERIDELGFVGNIAAWFDPASDFVIDDDICEWYQTAIERAADLALDTFNTETFSRQNTIYLLGTIAGLKGCRGPGRVLDNWLNSKECELTCQCSAELYVGESETGFTTEADDPTITNAEPRTENLPQWDFQTFDGENCFVWLSHLAIKSGHSELVDLLRFLFGWIICPLCSSRFSLIERLIEETEQ